MFINGLQVLFLVAGAHASLDPFPAMESEFLRKIRVRIQSAVSHVQVRGWDLKVSAPQILSQMARSSRGISGLSIWDFVCLPNEVQVRVQRDGMVSEVHRFRSPVTLRSPAGQLTVQSKPYRDEILIYASGAPGRRCEVVNLVELETYLEGVVNSEFSTRWSEESIAAQVVASRTYALFQIKSSDRNRHYDVDSTEKDQVYEGTEKVDSIAARVVKKTRGMVLTVGSGKKRRPLQAFYHSTCGGKTILPEAVWGKPSRGFKQGVVCPYCRSSPRFEWRATISEAELRTILREGGQMGRGLLASKGWPKQWLSTLSQGELRQIAARDLGPSEHVGIVVTSWTHAGGNYDLPISAQNFRNWIGAAKIRSTSFRIRKLQESLSDVGVRRWEVLGHGSGHGVGMCQWGAKVMGEKGFKMEKILRYYYPQARIQKLW